MCGWRKSLAKNKEEKLLSIDEVKTSKKKIKQRKKSKTVNDKSVGEYFCLWKIIIRKKDFKSQAKH